MCIRRYLKIEKQKSFIYSSSKRGFFSEVQQREQPYEVLIISRIYAAVDTFVLVFHRKLRPIHARNIILPPGTRSASGCFPRGVTD